MFNKFCKDESRSFKNQLSKNKYSSIWAAFTYFSYPSKVQEIIKKSKLIKTSLIIPKLAKLNQTASQYFTNARKYIPKKLNKHPDVKKFFEHIQKMEQKQGYDILIALCNKIQRKYGDKSASLLYLKYYLLKYCSQLFSNKQFISESLKTIQIFEKYHETTNFLIADFYEGLATHSILTNNIEAASKYAKKYSKILHDLVKSPSLELVKLYHLKSVIFRLQGLIENSEIFASLIIDEIKNTKDKLDDETVDFISQNLNFIIGRQIEKEEFDKAKDSIIILRKVFSENNIQSLEAYLALGQVNTDILISQGKVEEAIIEQKGSIQDFIEKGGSQQSYLLISCYLTLGHLHQKLLIPDYILANNYYEKGKNIAKLLFGDEHINTLNVEMYRFICMIKLGQANEAIQGIEITYKRAIDKYGANNPLIREIEGTYQVLMNGIQVIQDAYSKLQK